jgi:Zn-dependent protease with chaperone function
MKMNLNLVVEHYRESQDALKQIWGFLSRIYFIMRKINPLLSDGLAVFAGIMALLALLELVTLLSHLFSDKYITGLCAYPKGIYRLLRWILYQIRKVLNLVVDLLRFLWRLPKKEELAISPTEVFSPKAISQPTPTPIASLTLVNQIDMKSIWAIEARMLLQEALETDSRNRKVMRRLIGKATFRLELLGLQGDWLTLVRNAQTETKGTQIKKYVREILRISGL